MDIRGVERETLVTMDEEIGHGNLGGGVVGESEQDKNEGK